MNAVGNGMAGVCWLVAAFYSAGPVAAYHDTQACSARLHNITRGHTLTGEMPTEAACAQMALAGADQAHRRLRTLDEPVEQLEPVRGALTASTGGNRAALASLGSVNETAVKRASCAGGMSRTG